MKLYNQQEAHNARLERKYYTVYEIDTIPGLLERVEYVLFEEQRIDQLVFDRADHYDGFCWWSAYCDGVSLGFPVSDYDKMLIRWKHACDPGLANLKYLESASRD